MGATGFSWRLTMRARQRPGSPGGEYASVGAAAAEEQLEPMLLPASRVMDRGGGIGIEGSAAPRRSGSNASLLSAQSVGRDDSEED